MPAGKYTPLSHLRQALRSLPKDRQDAAFESVDGMLRVIRSAPDDKKHLVGVMQADFSSVSAQFDAPAREKVEAQLQLVLEDAWKQAKAKGLARNKETFVAHQKRLEATRREVQEAADRQIVALRSALKRLTGPPHVPPPDAKTIVSRAARPPIQASYWVDDGWQCLRIEERTIGHHRERAFIRPDTGRPALRFDPWTKKWMDWVRKLAAEFEIAPTSNQVRMVFVPGLTYTFAAWIEVPERPEYYLHPMDPDNAVKSTMDPLQASPYLGEKSPFGAFLNDTQVVDLLVFRLPQDGAPPVDRLGMAKEARKNRKLRPTRRASRRLAAAPPNRSEGDTPSEETASV